MIYTTVSGDIAASSNGDDIIVPCSTDLTELRLFGRMIDVQDTPILVRLRGSILTFSFDDRRLLHLIICYSQGDTSESAYYFLRFGLDCLSQNSRSACRKHSIGGRHLGALGLAYASSLYRAVSDSFLHVQLFASSTSAEELVMPSGPPLRFMYGWSVNKGLMNPGET